MTPTNAFDRKTLPHLREPGSAYFVTWRLAASQPCLTPQERDVVTASLLKFHGDRYDLLAWVVMDDHVHVVVVPSELFALDRATYGWKSFTANELMRQFNRQPSVWQRGSHDRVVRAGGELEEKLAYVRANPWRRWPELASYAWVWPQPHNS